MAELVAQRGVNRDAVNFHSSYRFRVVGKKYFLFLLLSGKTFDRADNVIACAVRSFRINCVVVSGVRLQAERADAEHRVGMLLVQPDVRLGCEVQVFGIRAVVENGEMLG